MIIPACFAQRALPAEMAAPFGSSRLGVGLVTALVWALAAGSALYWGLRASQPVAPVLPLAGRADGPAVDTRAVARALGAPDAAAAPAHAPVPAIASRVKLSGVVTHGAGGAVLLSVDGKPPRPYRVGATVDGDWVVRTVSPHAVELAAGKERARLEMPAMSERSSAGDAVAPQQPNPALVPGMAGPRVAVPQGVVPAPAGTVPPGLSVPGVPPQAVRPSRNATE